MSFVISMLIVLLSLVLVSTLRSYQYQDNRYQRANREWFDSPCHLRSPYRMNGTQLERADCRTFGGDDFVCDLQHLWESSQTRHILAHISKLEAFTMGIAEVGVVIQNFISVPDFDILSFYNRTGGQFYNYCTRLSAEQTRIDHFVWNQTLAKRYMNDYTELARQAWFDGRQCPRNALIVFVIEGIYERNDRPVIAGPLFNVAFSPELAKMMKLKGAGTIENIAEECIKRQIDYPTVVRSALTEIDTRVTTKYLHGGKSHSIPSWAKYTFAGCFALTIFALLVDYMVNRRSGSMLSMGGDGSKRKWAAGGMLTTMASHSKGNV